jgi:hypothetical protein
VLIPPSIAMVTTQISLNQIYLRGQGQVLTTKDPKYVLSSITTPKSILYKKEETHHTLVLDFIKTIKPSTTKITRMMSSKLSFASNYGKL